MARLRVVLDTGVLLSGLAHPNSIPGKLVRVWRQGGLEIALSRPMLNEMRRILARLPQASLTEQDIADLVDGFLLLTDVVYPDGRDDSRPGNTAAQWALETLQDSASQYLVTNDGDLLALADRYPVVTLVAFWMRHGE